MKKFLVGLLIALVCSFATVAQAEEVDPYFSCNIKNIDDYQEHDSRFKISNKNSIEVIKLLITGTIDDVYKLANKGEYFFCNTLMRSFGTYAKDCVWC